MAYTKGKISIPNVTGNIVITVTASRKAITNLADPTSAEWKSGYRINGSGSIVSGKSQVTNLIPVAVGDVIRIKNAGSSATMLTGSYPDASSTSGTPLTYTQSYDSESGIATITVNAAAYAYARFSIPNSQITDVNAIIITRNEII